MILLIVFANSFANCVPSENAISPEMIIVIIINVSWVDVIVCKSSFIAAAAPVLVLPME